jgi:hypothetical protein
MMLLSLRTLGPDCTPELHTRAAPELPAIHVKAASPLSLPQFKRRSTNPNLFYSSNDQNELVLDLRFVLVVHVRTSTPSRSANLKYERRRKRREQE